jgi:hypothetical protein
MAAKISFLHEAETHTEQQSASCGLASLLSEVDRDICIKITEVKTADNKLYETKLKM